MATGRTLDLEHVRFHVGSCGWWAMVAGPGSRQTRGQLLQMLLRSTRYFAAPFLLGEFHHEADLGPHTTALVRQEWFRVTRPGSEEPLSPQVVLFAAAAGVDLPNDPQESSDGRLPYLEPFGA